MQAMGRWFRNMTAQAKHDRTKMQSENKWISLIMKWIVPEIKSKMPAVGDLVRVAKHHFKDPRNNAVGKVVEVSDWRCNVFFQDHKEGKASENAGTFSGV